MNFLAGVTFKSLNLMGLSIVRTDLPDHSRRYGNFTFNQNYPARYVKSEIVCTKEMILQQKLLEKASCFVKMIGPAMVRPASSDFWKAPQVNEVKQFICCPTIAKSRL